MARSVTLSSIASSARFHADQRFSSFADDTQILALINDRIAELYDLIVDSFENYTSTLYSFSISSSTDTYSLPADFYKLVGVDYQVNNGGYVTLKPFEEAERNIALNTSLNIPSGTIRIRYVPAPTVYTSLSQTFDGVAGWDRLIALGVAIDLLDAEESDSSAQTRKYNATFERVTTMSQNRDSGMSHRVSDVNSANFFNIYGALQYKIYGDSIVLRNTELLGTAAWPSFF